MKKWGIISLTGFVLLLLVCLFLSRTWIYAAVPRVRADVLAEGSVEKRIVVTSNLVPDGGMEYIPHDQLNYEYTVKEVCASVGDEVQQGDVLLICEPGQALIDDLAQAERTVENARLSLLGEDEEIQRCYALYRAYNDAINEERDNPNQPSRVKEARNQLESALRHEGIQDALTTYIQKQERLERDEQRYAELTALCERVREIVAPQDGVLSSLSGQVGESLFTTEPAVVVVRSSTLQGMFPITQEQAAYFQTAQIVSTCNLRVGGATLATPKPKLIANKGRPCLFVTYNGSLSFQTMSCTLEVSLLCGQGMLLPRTAIADTQAQKGSVALFILTQKDGFWGKEDYIKRIEVDVLDYDEEHLLLRPGSIGTGERVVVEYDRPLADAQQVLVVK